MVRANNHNYITYTKLQDTRSDVRITLTGHGMIRGGTLSFIEASKEPVGIPIDVIITTTSSNTTLQNTGS